MGRVALTVVALDLVFSKSEGCASEREARLGD